MLCFRNQIRYHGHHLLRLISLPFSMAFDFASLVSASVFFVYCAVSFCPFILLFFLIFLSILFSFQSYLHVFFPHSLPTCSVSPLSLFFSPVRLPLLHYLFRVFLFGSSGLSYLDIFPSSPLPLPCSTSPLLLLLRLLNLRRPQA